MKMSWLLYKGRARGFKDIHAAGEGEACGNGFWWCRVGRVMPGPADTASPPRPKPFRLPQAPPPAMTSSDPCRLAPVRRSLASSLYFRGSRRATSPPPPGG